MRLRMRARLYSRILVGPFRRALPGIWTRLGQYRGKQQLYTRQSAQALRILREHAIIESAVSSNRIEGVSLDLSRLKGVLAAVKPLFRDRDEEEIRGYRDALRKPEEPIRGFSQAAAAGGITRIQGACRILLSTR